MDAQADDFPSREARSEAAMRQLVGVVAAFARELHPRRGETGDVVATSRLEQDLGIDSLARTELILRLERAFHRRLPIEAMGRAETVADVLAALEAAAEAPLRVVASEPVPLPPVTAASEATTLVEALEWHAARHPERLHLSFLTDATTVAGSLTYGCLAREARRAAAGLAALDVTPGDRVALMLPTGLDFFIGFFGVLYAGAIPVPIYPPMRLSQIEDHLRRQIGILRNAGVKMLITAPEAARFSGFVRGQIETLDRVAVVAELTAAGGDGLPPARMDAQATAMLQYTSGSTGDPKGVVLSHANLLANIRAMGKALRASSADVFVSWLPLYHDMGLIGAWFGCLYFGAPLFVMSPLTFLARPACWLRAIHTHRGTLSAAPNFAFELCLDKIDASELEGLDLCSLRMVANGAEPVGVRTIRRFAEKFAEFGFRPQAMAPVYGLAENAVGLAFPPMDRAPLIDRIDRDALTLRAAAEPAPADDPHALELVSSGLPLPLHEIRIVDEAGRELGERREGRLEFRGPSATSGYFRNEAKTRELIRDGWLDSGDRAYLAGGEVFITGRIKDILIRAGRHLYPQEIEAAIGEIDGVRKGCVAAFGVADAGTERIIVVAETYATEPAARAALEAKAQEQMSALAGAPAEEIVLVPPRATPKTSSGKIRRSAARDLYLQGRLGAPQRAVWLQLSRLAVAGLRPAFARLLSHAGDWAYAVWWWLVIAGGYAVVWLVVMATPGLERRWAVTRRIARAMLFALGVPVSVEGLERLPPGGAMLVFNHSSYMDVTLLAACLPGAPAYVAKRELAGQLFAGPFLRRLGALFVERFDAVASVADAEALTASAREGRNLVFFPEGTFTRRPGLSGFHLGAFKIAAEAALPVYPGVLSGTRSMLRGEQWFPRRVPLSLCLEAPVWSQASDFSAALRLRETVRGIILERCGEPDIDEFTRAQSH